MAQGFHRVPPLSKPSVQRAYLDHLKAELLPSKDGGPVFFGDGGDFRAVARDSLERLKQQVAAGIQKSEDAITRSHLRDCGREIDAMLAHKK